MKEYNLTIRHRHSFAVGNVGLLVHYHVEKREDVAKSWKKKNLIKVKPKTAIFVKRRDFFQVRNSLGADQMSRQSLQCDIGFADSEVEGYARAGVQLKVRVRAWNESFIEFVFDDIVRVLDDGVGEISDVCMEMSQTDLMSGALAIEFEQMPSDHPYREYVFLDIDDVPSLRVVAARVDVICVGTKR